MRLVMGPLSLLAHAPLLGRLPFTPAMGTLAGAFTVAATSAAGGLAAPPHHHAAAHVARPAPHVRHVTPPRPAAKKQPLSYVHLVGPPAEPAAPQTVSPQPAPAPAPAPPPAPAPAPVAPPAPSGVDDTATVYEGETVAIDVLANDTGGPFALTSVGRPAHGSAAIVGDRIDYRSDEGFHGADSFVYHASAAGSDVSATVSVQVLGVNQAPRFTAGAAVTVDEDALPYSAPWATGVDAGEGDIGQQVHFVVKADQPALFSTQPQVSPDGTLSFSLAPDAFGSSQVSVQAVDDGGTAHGGVDTSAAQSFALNVLPVNDPPSFTAGANVTVVEDAGPQSLQCASGIAAGPPNEAGQHVSFDVATDQPGLFAPGGEPLISPSGVLTFTPGFHAVGTA